MNLFGWWSVALLAIFLIGVTKSGFGSGVGLIIVPMMTLSVPYALPSENPLGLLLPLMLCGDIIALYQYRKNANLAVVRKLLPATLIGTLIGGLILLKIRDQGKLLAESLIWIDIGLESVFLVSLHWYRVWKMRGWEGVYIPRTWHNQLVGGVAGISSTLAHAAGPLVAVYLLPQKMTRQRYVGTCAVYFFILNTLKLPIFAYIGLLAKTSTVPAMGFLPLVLAGALFGVWVNRFMSDQWFSRVVYFLTFCLGLYILYDGIIGLMGVMHGAPAIPAGQSAPV